MSQRRSISRVVVRGAVLATLAASGAAACSDGDTAGGGGSYAGKSSQAGQGATSGGGNGTSSGGETGDGGAGDGASGGAVGGDESGAGGSGASAGQTGDGNGLASVRGIVTAFRPNLAGLEERVPGALVTLDDGVKRYEAISDGSGFFELDAVAPGAAYRVKVTVDAAARQFHDGMPYADWYGELRALADQTTSLMPRLTLGCAIDVTVAANAEATFSTSGTGSHGCGTYDLVGKLVIPAGGLTHSNGEPFAGSTRLEFSPIWFPTVASGNVSFASLAAMPPLVGVPAQETEPEPMHTFAAADVRVTDAATGEPLALATGKVAELTLRGFRELTSEDDYGSWSFDPGSGTWREEGACTADVSDPQLVHCEVRHFSWWNADGRSGGPQGGGGTIGRRCVAGGVLYQGQPLVGASVLGTANAGIVGAAQAETDENGAFCAYGVSEDGAWDIQVRVENGREILSQTVSVSAGGKLGGDCEAPETCSQAGVIELESSPVITVYGRLGLQDGSEKKPMPTGGFSFGRRVRAIGSPDAFGFVQLNLGEIALDAQGGYEFHIPEPIVRLFFVSPGDGECKTYPSPVPGEGTRVEINDQFFVCGT
jgi:hypothetical protein